MSLPFLFIFFISISFVTNTHNQRKSLMRPNHKNTLGSALYVNTLKVKTVTQKTGLYSFCHTFIIT